MCLHTSNKTIGDIFENHCSLHDAIARITTSASNIDSLWHDEFQGKDDQEIFKILDEYLYIGDHALWPCYGHFDFLTNSGEQFDDTKTFLYRSPLTDQLHLLYQCSSEPPASSSFPTNSFLESANGLKHWFQHEISKPPARLYPVDPFESEKA